MQLVAEKKERSADGAPPSTRPTTVVNEPVGAARRIVGAGLGAGGGGGGGESAEIVTPIVPELLPMS